MIHAVTMSGTAAMQARDEYHPGDEDLSPGTPEC